MKTNNTPAKEAKRLGTTVQQMSDATGVSRQTLANWYANKPRLFEAVAIGVKTLLQAIKP